MTAPGSLPLAVRPKLRGVTHQWAFFVSLALGAALVAAAPGGRATAACAVYAGSVAGLFGASALYHRITWSRASARRGMRRLDHSMIFVLIAGTYTPFTVLALEGRLATAILIVVWVGALGGVVLKLVWIDAPKPLVAGVYVALGWVAVATLPGMLDAIGIVATLLVGLGGVLYTAGAVVYARRRPDPVPTVFGYHEVFHLLVVVAAALQYAVVAFWVVPGA
jgi:hemolysin III